mmetsp:Transcript_62292/g.103575  ORF Transcript_62292/g.103575 Transcript_62292/m.103575 type:complete len:299 (-) Transcript_62292:119-1015(-)|eukprot:CAMPEP_0119326154 /NCGR_PEP_ID=MMETSP1333-20130426/67641_1 /TAXON_ID=418940 /ORGANISM="Scyphosphaera apsteinii, Strain RCC1455" /LENGTH=298 /DNA_ID=CAMNT_0007334377 /DNA_START=37 /DNA_END=933 /DNA_ORIENTATION=-
MWFADALKSAAQSVQVTLEEERQGFMAEFIRSGASSGNAASINPCGAPSQDGNESAMSVLQRVGLNLLNPLQDQAALSTQTASRSAGVIMLPWEQPGLSAEVRARMRGLSQDRAVFLSPPDSAACTEFKFEMRECVGVVLEALSVDKHLERQRHQLVPQQVSEEMFFRNYFWHLHAIAHGSPIELASDTASTSSAVLIANSSSSEGTEVAAPSRSVTPAEGSLEEQFESISDEMLANAVSSKLRPTEGESAASSPLTGAPAPLESEAPLSDRSLEATKEVDALSSLNWEKELAELVKS